MTSLNAHQAVQAVQSVTKPNNIASVSAHDYDMVRNLIGHITPGGECKSVKISASQMGVILRACAYQLQMQVRNPNSPAGRVYVQGYADDMKTGEWISGKRIEFIWCKWNNRWLLADGNHRGYAQKETGVTIVWDVKVYAANTEDEMRQHFSTIDNGRVRSAQQQARIMAPLMVGVSATAKKGGLSAVAIIDEGFALGRVGRDTVKRRNMRRRCRDLGDWEPELQLFDLWVKSATKVIKRKLFLAGPLAVALVTIRHQRKRAEDFWPAVAQDCDPATGAGLQKNDPRKVLNKALYERNLNAGHYNMSVMLPAAAWNAFYQGNTIPRLVILQDAKLRIYGTPIDVTPPE